ncbi:dephospho-CoA kinase [Pseudonocardia sp.]|uniref:dephospho-CoA kinase n=1 Tax=Pseudonocardia sp. TaxID=60912 RepID=UPI003D0F20E6
MLRIGLTGGIGSGKSTVARRLVARGAVLVDSDVLAREVVAAGTDGLAAIVDEFGPGVLGADGELDRAALAAVVFGGGGGDGGGARARLNAIVHPRVRARSAELVAAAPADAIVVQDVPLLVEGGMAAGFPLVVVVHADAEVRVRRLVRDRGMAEPDARARIAAQATDRQRHAVADVWLDNSGSPDVLLAAVDTLWDDRLVPFEENLRRGRPAAAPPGWTAADPGWAAQGARAAARVAAAGGDRIRAVAHVGATAVAGLAAPDVLELVAVVTNDTACEPLRGPLAAAGLVPSGPPDRYAGADPGRPATLDLCLPDSPEWREALALRDWLRSEPSARTEYCGIAERGGTPIEVAGWVHEVRRRVLAWTASTGWEPSLT